MTSVVEYGWTWDRDIGLWWGVGPRGERATVARPRMTSPWWVADVGDQDTVTWIFPSARQAMRYVSAPNRSAWPRTT